MPEGFAIYSGDDPTAVALMLCGGQGNISVTANVAPRLMPVHKNLFVEANPIPVKWAMARMGLCGGTLRLPMTPMSASFEPVVEGALRAAGLV